MMNNRKRKGVDAMPLGLLAVLLLCLTQSVTAATSYLQELEAEATRGEDTEQGTSAAPSRFEDSRALVQNAENIEAGLSKEQFESSLQNAFYGSYLFYSTLDEGKKQRVYDDYNNDNNIESIRESIKQQMKN
ncbi:MAG: hypothetical protein OQK94_06055 [Gammaproteobacteria bacterium]|nr:hypothetical protein [Gammaproteobacteria bacterium]MCW8839587.1 hypothetical protein [Gammaproteobacteria bacterium]MCW8958511.1 hypothetical protein [Gammaproteobacteria bacterium]MCW8973658.1 hypothetical protein [Gammaproteobacteria bacterium]MCW8991686.1 hypothetical protein [Gammaproteobacteria bacterium]